MRVAAAVRATARAWAQIDGAALKNNVRLLHARFGGESGTRLMAVVKADAYGHGMKHIAPVCVREGIKDFGVATVDEGAALRALLPPALAIYLLAPTLPADAPDIVHYGLTPLVGTSALGKALAKAARARGVTTDAHLDVDTGIGRSGISASDAPALLRELDCLPNLRVTGLATHFASADEDPADAHAQYAQFIDLLEQLGPRARALTVHADNSPAALVLPPETRHALVRPGLLLYGIEPAPGMLTQADLLLRPVLSLKARVLLCRPLPEGATVSYGRTFTVPAGGGVYATLGIGYGDGYPRRLGGGVGDVLLRGQRAPICGRVCMDQLVVDVTRIPAVHEGDTATLVGSDGPETLTAAGLAALIDTTPHEITTCLTARLPRLA